MSVKQVIIIRKDLKIRRGKECSQAAHASMAWLVNRIREEAPLEPTQRKDYLTSDLIPFSPAEYTWLNGAFTKITLQVDSEEELRSVYARAKEAGLVAHIIVDAGKTEFNGVPTATAVAIGPDEAEKIDPITENLKLY